MMNPLMPGAERFPNLFDWYLERCINRYVNHVCETVTKDEGIEATTLDLVAESAGTYVRGVA